MARLLAQVKRGLMVLSKEEKPILLYVLGVWKSSHVGRSNGESQLGVREVNMWPYDIIVLDKVVVQERDRIFGSLQRELELTRLVVFGVILIIVIKLITHFDHRCHPNKYPFGQRCYDEAPDKPNS